MAIAMACGRWQQAIGRAAVPSPSSETGLFGCVCLFVCAFARERRAARSFGFARAVVRSAPLAYLFGDRSSWFTPQLVLRLPIAVLGIATLAHKCARARSRDRLAQRPT
jgi:hypothetical protein